VAGSSEAGRPRRCRGGAAAVLWLRAGVPERRVEATHPAAMAGGGGGKVRRGQACWIAGAPRGGPLRAGARRRAARWRRRGGVRRGSAEARLGRSFGRGERERRIFGFALPPDPKWVTVMGALLEAYFLPEMTVQDPYLGLGCIVGDSLSANSTGGTVAIHCSTFSKNYIKFIWIRMAIKFIQKL